MSLASRILGRDGDEEIRPCEYFKYHLTFVPVRVCRRLRAVALEWMLARRVFLVTTYQDLSFLIDHLQFEGLIQRLTHLHFLVYHDLYRQRKSDSRKSLLLMMLTDIAILLSKLPTTVRSLKFQVCSDIELAGKCHALLWQSLSRFQELETLSWATNLSFVQFEQHSVFPSVDLATLATDSRCLASYPDGTDYIPLSQFRKVPFVLPRSIPTFSSLLQLHLSGIVSVLPHQMAEALSATQLPSLTSLHLSNIAWHHDLKKIMLFDSHWSLFSDCFVSMHPLSELRWIVYDDELDCEESQRRYSIAPEQKIMETIQAFHGGTLKNLAIDYRYIKGKAKVIPLQEAELRMIDWNSLRRGFVSLDQLDIILPHWYHKLYRVPTDFRFDHHSTNSYTLNWKRATGNSET